MVSLIEDLQKTLKDGKSVTVVEDADAPPAPPEKKKGNKTVKTSTKAQPSNANKSASNGHAGKERDGLLGAVRAAFLKATSVKSAVTRDAVIDKLTKDFPHRESKSIRKNVSDYLTWWAPKKYHDTVHKSADGTKIWVKAAAK
jgi:hypothetical protein